MWRKFYVCLFIAVILCAIEKPVNAEASYNFLLPGEFVVTRELADVTGDQVADTIYLVGSGDGKNEFARNVNIIVEDGVTKEVARSFLNQVSGYRAGLEIGDFNGDKLNDVMLTVQKPDLKTAVYIVSFTKDTPTMIYQSKDDVQKDIRSGEVVITEKDHKKIVRVKKGSTIQLRLPQNESTGYTWKFTQSTGGECVTFLGQQNYVPNGEVQVVGQPGLIAFTFKANQVGTLDMMLANFREWEGQENAVDHFEVKVEIVE